MSTIVLSEIAQNGVKGAKKVKPKLDENYKKVMQEADERIEESHIQYANAYKKASNYIVI